jgi:hypothetical protein
MEAREAPCLPAQQHATSLMTRGARGSPHHRREPWHPEGSGYMREKASRHRSPARGRDRRHVLSQIEDQCFATRAVYTYLRLGARQGRRQLQQDPGEPLRELARGP